MADEAAAARPDGAEDEGACADIRTNGLDVTKKTLAAYEQYGDIMLAAILRDIQQAKCPLEINARPAYTQNPGRVANILSDKEMTELYNDVVKAYG